MRLKDSPAPAEYIIRSGITAWINYFVQYPGIFDLFFQERIGAIGNRNDIAETIFNSADGKLTDEEAAVKLDAIRSRITGMLLYYSSRKNPSDYAGLLRILNRQFDEFIR